MLAICVVLMSSCKRVVIKIDSIPENTPADQPIYVTGNFNNWDPGEEMYILRMGTDSNYYFKLPPGYGTVEYKFTRGDWTTVEKGLCGEEIDNRQLSVATNDTITNSIQSWNDLDPVNCPQLTIKIENMPKNTPVSDVIAIASNFNSWDPDDLSVFKKSSSGDMYLTVNRPPGINRLEYKLTRGKLSASESDEFGNAIPNRIVEFGKKDTVKVNIEGWTDLPKGSSNLVTLIIKNLPENTPHYDDLFMASNLNSWVTDDRNYQFQRNSKDQLFISVPRKEIILEYKVTRGDWNTQEVDKNGYHISNREVDLENIDSVYIDIIRWEDMGRSGGDDITVILDSLPVSTPDGAKIYISGNFNGWNPGRLRHRFRKNANGEYAVNLPRDDGDIEFRITRGSWETAQLDSYGSDIFPYTYNYYDIDTLFVNVENWKDMPTKEVADVTLVIDMLPENTPTGDNIFLAPEFNGWNPGDENWIFDKLPDGRLIITFPTNGNTVKYKITRGGWDTVELNEEGNDIPNRAIYYGFADTVHINVLRWRDLNHHH